MLRALATAFSMLGALPAFALCGGESYLDQLPPETQDEVAAAVAATPNADGLIWELTRGEDRITLVGTMHIFDPRLTPLFEKVAPALRGAEHLLVEATDAEMLEMQAAFAADPSLYLITEGPTLPDLLSAEVWAQVQDAAAARGLPGFVVAQMQPWYLALTLGIPACAMADLAAGAKGLDHMLMAEAEAAGVPVAPLEPWDTLVTLMSEGGMEAQIDMMRMGLIDAADQQALFVAMLDSYFSQQIAVVWEISQIAARDLSGLSEAEAAAEMLKAQEALLDSRNRNWVPVIEEAMQTHDDVMVAVGAAHLPGEVGLIALLETEGWTATRLP